MSRFVHLFARPKDAIEAGVDSLSFTCTWKHSFNAFRVGPGEYTVYHPEAVQITRVLLVCPVCGETASEWPLKNLPYLRETAKKQTGCFL